MAEGDLGSLPGAPGASGGGVGDSIGMLITKIKGDLASLQSDLTSLESAVGQEPQESPDESDVAGPDEIEPPVGAGGPPPGGVAAALSGFMGKPKMRM